MRIVLIPGPAAIRLARPPPRARPPAGCRGCTSGGRSPRHGWRGRGSPPSAREILPRLCAGAERGIAGADPFVHQQDLRPDRGGDSEGQAQLHASGIAADRQIEEIPKPCQRRRLALERGQRFSRQPTIQAAQADVLPPCRKGLHPRGRINQAADLARHLKPPRRRFVDAREGRSSGLAGAIGAEEGHPLARGDSETNANKRLYRDMPSFHGQAAGGAAKQPFLQAVRAEVIDGEADRKILGVDVGHRHPHTQ